jgi:hypothetical protein
MHNNIPTSSGTITLAARRLALPALGAGLLGGLPLIVVMILVMGSAGMGYVALVLHFAYAGFLGLVFAALIGAAAWLHVPGLRSSTGIVIAAVAGGALLSVIMRWGLLPPTTPMMALVPQLAFVLAHLLFGLVVGVVLAAAVTRYRQPLTGPTRNEVIL